MTAFRECNKKIDVVIGSKGSFTLFLKRISNRGLTPTKLLVSFAFAGSPQNLAAAVMRLTRWPPACLGTFAGSSACFLMFSSRS